MVRHLSKVSIPPLPLLSFSRGPCAAEAALQLLILHFPGDRITDFWHHTQLEFSNLTQTRHLRNVVDPGTECVCDNGKRVDNPQL